MALVISNGYQWVFDQQYINSTDYVILTIAIEDTAESGMTGIDPETNGLVVTKWGKLKWTFDLDDPFIVPGTADFEFFDPNESLAGKLFDNAQESTIDPKAEVTVSLNGTVIFDGRVLEDSIIWDEGLYKLSFSVVSNVEKINKQRLFDLDNGVAFNPHSYSASVGSTYWPTLRTFITNIWQAVSPTLAVDFYSRWTVRDDGAATYNLFNTGIRINHHLFYTYSERNTLGLENDGDVLTMPCTAFNCNTGLVDRSEAFFKQLFTYDSGNVQTLGTVLDYKKQFLKTKVDYVRYVSHESSIGDYDYAQGTLEESGLEVTRIEQEPVFHGFDPSYLSCLAYYGSGSNIEDVQDTGIDSTWRDCLEMASKNLFHARNNIFRQRQDYFLVEGVNYQFHKNFTYNSLNWMITSMEIDLPNDRTEIIAAKVV